MASCSLAGSVSYSFRSMYPRQVYFMVSSPLPSCRSDASEFDSPLKNILLYHLRAMDAIRERLDAIYHEERGRILATLIRLLGDFDLAEDAMHEAFSAALAVWPREGIPASPRAWLISTGRFKAIDALRRRSRLGAVEAVLAEQLELHTNEPELPEALEDDRLRLIFTCCHPALPVEGRLALTLREVCGLTTEAIASAFLTTAPTLAQRIVRAKAKIRAERIPYQVPPEKELPERLDAVLHVVYLLFNEGYSASSGDALLRPDLSAEAIRVGRLLHDLLPEPEVAGLLGLMLLQESRRAARVSPSGDLVLLLDQPRAFWTKEQISEGTPLIESALSSRGFGRYTLQGAIAAVHAEAKTAAETDWRQITALYAALA